MPSRSIFSYLYCLTSPRCLFALGLLFCGAVLAGCRKQAPEEIVQLDRAVDDYPLTIAKREQQIDSVRNAHYTSDYQREMALQSAFGNYSLDSAIYHTHRAVIAAGNPREVVAAHMALASHYNTSGVMYKEAYDIFRHLNRADVDSAGMTFGYYSLAVQLFRNLATHSLDPDLKSEYLKSKVLYRDSALMLDPDNEVLLANRYIDSGEYSRAIAILGGDNTSGTSRSDAVRYNLLAEVSRLQGDRANARRYLALSALCDLTNGVREYLSLQDLAMMLYEDGDYDRAYTYIHRSIADATACNAKQRMLEMSTMLPIIEIAHEEKQAAARRVLYISLAIIGLLSVSLCVVIYKIRGKNRKLATVNMEQQSLNNRLTESDSIKEAYITHFMNLCLEYLAQMESYRRELLRIAAHRNFDELCKTIESSRYIGKGINDFYEKFDDAFLDIFPSFISDLRSLLSPDYVIRLKKGERLNTELRIFALMRLGFTDSDSICRFLRCSPSTVYNYRTRIRSVALDRDSFDRDIQRIGRVFSAEET